MSHQIRKLHPRDTTKIDTLVSIAAVIHPLMAMPQVYDIYTTRDVQGISLTTWIGFMLVGLIFLVYGIAHRLKPIIITQVLWFVVDLLVIIGIVYYR